MSSQGSPASLPGVRVPVGPVCPGGCPCPPGPCQGVQGSSVPRGGPGLPCPGTGVPSPALGPPGCLHRPGYFQAPQPRGYFWPPGAGHVGEGPCRRHQPGHPILGDTVALSPTGSCTRPGVSTGTVCPAVPGSLPATAASLLLNHCPGAPSCLRPRRTGPGAVSQAPAVPWQGGAGQHHPPAAAGLAGHWHRPREGTLVTCGAAGASAGSGKGRAAGAGRGGPVLPQGVGVPSCPESSGVPSCAEGWGLLSFPRGWGSCPALRRGGSCFSPGQWESCLALGAGGPVLPQGAEGPVLPRGEGGPVLRVQGSHPGPRGGGPCSSPRG